MSHKQQLLIVGLSTIAIFAAIHGIRTWIAAQQPGYLTANHQTLTWKSPLLDEAPHPNGPGSEIAAVTFILRNTGGRSVKILSTQSSCGCTKPEVEPSIISPGEECHVNVRATPLFLGERLVNINLTTDSPAQPTIQLQLLTIGGKTPPFMLDVKGNLSFYTIAEDSTKGKRDSEIEIVTVQQPHDSGVPKLQNHFDGLKFELIDTTTRPYITPGIFYRTYKYHVSFLGDIAEDHASGVVEVQDPWLESNSRSLHVYVEKRRNIQTSPSRLIHTVKHLHDTETVTRFLIISTDERLPEPLFDQATLNRFQITTENGANPQSKICKLRLLADAGQSMLGFHNLRMTLNMSKPVVMDLPVLVRHESSGHLR